MLSLTRRLGQRILIGRDVEVTILGVQGGKVRLGIAAPRSVPVHRAELVAKVEAQNRHALARTVAQGVEAGQELRFPEGLFGLREHTAFVLCDLAEGNPIRCLVSCVDPAVQLLVIDAETAWPSYPLDAARAALGVDGEVAVALVVNVPADGGPATANTLAPLVLAMDSREGRQVVLERPGLRVDAAIGKAPGEGG
ncbi:MAG: carbon storage regulator [Sandaracinaceae bacterium]